MSIAENRELATRFIEDVLNRRDPGAMAELAAPGMTDQLKTSMTMYLVLASFPDFRATIDHVIATDDKVTVLASFTATHEGEFMGVPPTGRGVTGKLTAFFRTREGKVVESWQNWDPWGLMEQLGVYAFANPAMPREAAVAAD